MMLSNNISSRPTTQVFSDAASASFVETQTKGIKFGDTFRTVSSVFSESVLNEANRVIDDDKSYFNSAFVNRMLKKRTISKVIESSTIFDDLKFWLNCGNPVFSAELCYNERIQFDENGHLIKGCFRKDCLATSSDEIWALCSEALEKMADEFQWRDRSVEVSGIALIRYPLIPSRGIKNMVWHKDPGKKSMVVQLNDNTNATGTGVKYSGGGLDIGKMSSSSNPMETLLDEGTEESFSYDGRNNGLRFSNEHSLIHRAGDIVYLSENADDLEEKRIIVVVVDD
ncbi:hypothetical protein [Endozoicomonas sp. 8E]|uniref:hypothetical protein n=1 Tax=Endozoicomonas sp. 8E TaxID=3035692 RepID=UPI002938DA9D|nr:hypothetical protein [Endozoicomonas sp. 8E]WOG27851.1 hypothetical protein P6910_25435 [Endozoicomonas sp. 8E]